MVSRTSERGFGLIEVMIALVVLSVSLLGAAMMQANMTSSTNLARQRGEALFVARDLMERMRGMVVPPVCKSESKTFKGKSASYAYVVACDAADPSVATVTVVWVDASGESNTVVLQSRI